MIGLWYGGQKLVACPFGNRDKFGTVWVSLCFTLSVQRLSARFGSRKKPLSSSGAFLSLMSVQEVLGRVRHSQ